MTESERMTPEALRAVRAEQPKVRDRDLAAALGISEAQLMAAHVGHGAVRIVAHPDRIMPELEVFGPLMGLTNIQRGKIEY